MDGSKISRRTLLAGTSALLAGCLNTAPESEPSNEEILGTSNKSDSPDPLGNDSVPESTEQAYEVTAESVGKVRVEGVVEDEQGSGWIYDRENRHIVTAQHIVSNDGDIFVRFPETGWVTGTLIGEDRLTDLALIEVEELPDNVPALELQTTMPRTGSEIATIGYPLERERSISVGTLAGTSREFGLSDRPTDVPHGVQVDTALNSGDSGGAIVTPRGTLIGSITAGDADNIGYGVSSILIEQVIPALRETGTYEHPRIGLEIIDVSPRVKTANGLDEAWGVYVISVDQTGPAGGKLRGNSGTERVRGRETPTGGDVILSLNGDRVRDVDELAAWLTKHADPGDEISIGFRRDGELQSTNVTLGVRDGETGG